MALTPMALKRALILRRPPPGPAIGRPEDRLRGRLEERRALIPPPVIPAKQGATELNRAARHLAPLAGRGRKPRIACLPGEGRLSPHPPVPCRRKGLLTPALSLTVASPARGGGGGWGQAGRGSTARLRPVDAVDHRAASLNTCPFLVIPAQAGTQSPQSRPAAHSPRSLRAAERPIAITHRSDPQTHQEF
jgi:hypothetical protein